jgi:hypothetical protein
MNRQPRDWIGWTRASSRHNWRPVVRERTEAAAFARALASIQAGDACAVPEGRRPMPTRAQEATP